MSRTKATQALLDHSSATQHNNPRAMTSFNGHQAHPAQTGHVSLVGAVWALLDHAHAAYRDDLRAAAFRHVRQAVPAPRGVIA
ncbi:hypothetical protein ACTG9Q_05125 [Actinokineospora sp. 24-640]